MNYSEKWNKFILLILLSAHAFFLNGCSNKSSTQKKSKKPNIIILVADDMGYGDLQSYGNPNIRTPNLDSLADQGIRFTSYEAAPECVSSRAELMTGAYVPRIHFDGIPAPGFGLINGHGGLQDSVLTLAEGLKKAGYATGMAGKWHLGYHPKEFLPTNRGFDSWLGLPYSNDYQRPYVPTDVPLVMYRNTKVVENPVNEDSMTVKYTAEARHFIRAHSDEEQPFFFYLAYNMVHLPIHTTTQFLGTSDAGLYGDVVQTIDWSVGKVLQTLKKEGLEDNTIVFFASDNGPWSNAPPRMFRAPNTPPLGEHWELRGGANKPWYTGSSGPLRGAKHTAWEGGTRVPAMIRWPGHIKAGQVSSELVTNLDMFRTFLTLGGGNLPDYPTDGYDMLPFFTDQTSHSPRREYAYFNKRKFVGLRVGKWKLKINRKKPQLYNLQVDVSEKYNVAGTHPEIVRQIKKKIDSIANNMGMKNLSYDMFKSQ